MTPEDVTATPNADLRADLQRMTALAEKRQDTIDMMTGQLQEARRHSSAADLQIRELDRQRIDLEALHLADEQTIRNVERLNRELIDVMDKAGKLIVIDEKPKAAADLLSETLCNHWTPPEKRKEPQQNNRCMVALPYGQSGVPDFCTMEKPCPVHPARCQCGQRGCMECEGY